MWDLFNYMICAALCFLIFLAFDEKAFVGKINGPALALLMFLYGWAMIPLMYPFSRMFKVSVSVIALLAQVQAVSQQLLSVTSIVMSINEQLCCWWDILVTFPHCYFDSRSQKYSVKNLGFQNNAFWDTLWHDLLMSWYLSICVDFIVLSIKTALVLLAIM